MPRLIILWLALAATTLPLSARELRVRQFEHDVILEQSDKKLLEKDTFEVVVDDNEPDVAYFPSNANTIAIFSMLFQLPSAPVTVDEVAYCLTRDGTDSDLAVAISFWDDDGPGGEPGTLLDAVGVAISGVPAFPSVGLATLDIAGAGITLPDETAFVGLAWDPSVDNDFALCGDQDGAVVYPGFYQTNFSGGWSTIQTAFGDPAYNALFIRGTFTTVDGTPTFSSEAGLIVPGFEVDVADPEGPTTFFAVRNTSDTTVDVNVDFYGDQLTDEPLRTDVLTLGPQQTATRNVRANLSNLNVDDGIANGLIVISEAGSTGTAKGLATNLEGDYFRIDFGGDFATGERLVTPADFCLRQEIRFVDFGSGSELRIMVDDPQGMTAPSITYTVYNEAGVELDSGVFFISEHLTVIDAEELTDANFGTMVMDFTNAGGGFATGKYSAFGRFSLELNAACLDD